MATRSMDLSRSGYDRLPIPWDRRSVPNWRRISTHSRSDANRILDLKGGMQSLCETSLFSNMSDRDS